MKTFTLLRKSFLLVFFLLSSLIVRAQIIIDITTTPSCNNDGLATAVPSNGVSPYIVNWSYYDRVLGYTVFFTGETIQNLPGYASLSVVVTDAASSTQYQYAQMQYLINPNTIELRPNCNTDGTISFSPSGGTSPYTYNWSNGSTSSSMENLQSGTYIITVSDAGGCFVVDTSYLYNNEISIYQGSSVPSVCKDDGSATVVAYGGNPPYSVKWNTGFVGFTAPNLSSGKYSVTVTDATGCTSSSDNITVGSNNPMEITSTTIPANCKNEGSATVSANSGTAPYTYEWDVFPSQTGSTASSLFAGPNKVIVTDGTDCKKAFIIDIPFDPIIQVAVTYTESSCHDGTITVNPSGGTAPYSYYWQTSPVQTGQTATGLRPGYYTVKITDANGCENVVGQTVPLTDLLVITPNVNNENCEAKDGSISLSVSGGQSPYTYQWLGYPSITTSNITGLEYGWYEVTVTDVNGCDKTEGILINRFSPVNISLNTTAPSCNNADGTATITVTGGTGPYIYTWNNGSTASSQTTLPEGYYYVQVKDANQCVDHTSFWLQDIQSCYPHISGRVIADKNGNCSIDGDDFGIGGVLIQENAMGSYYTYTDSYGFYSFKQEGTSIGLYQYPVEYFNYECPVNGLYNFSASPGTAVMKDFYNIPLSDNDLSINIYPDFNARPGFAQGMYLYYHNQGNTKLDATISFTHDNTLSFVESYPPPSNYVSNNLTFEVNDLIPGQAGYFWLIFQVPSTTPLGVTLKHYASISPLIDDVLPSNNFDTLLDVVRGAYDPNMIEVEPKGASLPGYINKSDSLLKYTIHFQNTGTDTAFNIMVMDTLDANHNVASVVPKGSSHNYTLDILPGNILKFHFKNILLPDSNVNEKKSHGLVNYTVKLLPNRPEGTVIKNTAEIYFDYNVPVRTNTAVNTIKVISGIAENKTHHFSMQPNPMQESTTISIANFNSKNDYSIRIFDILGHEVRKINNISSDKIALKRESLLPGVYFFQLLENNIKLGVGKLVLK